MANSVFFSSFSPFEPKIDMFLESDTIKSYAPCLISIV